MTETQSCIWLQCVFGPGNTMPARIAAEYSSIADFYNAGIQEWRISGLFTGAQLDKMEETSPREAETILNQCDSGGYQAIGITNPRYPACLRELHAPPAVLYVHGTLPDFEHGVAVGMVGTREASPYGIQVAAQLATGLASRGAIVVSGGALGIDTASHRGALMGGGCTVAVLGCGFNARYLMTNASLRQQIARTGALISEYPPNTPVTPGSFPMRNRIIAALSRGTVVVEAGQKSGALITARQALELGRDVFAVPGNIMSKGSAGVNLLLKEGAKAVARVSDILEEYETVYGEYLHAEKSRPVKAAPAAHYPEQTKIKKPAPKKKSTQSTKAERIVENPTLAAELEMLSPDAKALYGVLTMKPEPVDELGTRAGLQPRQVLAAVTELEMLGMIQPMPGKLYALK